MRNKGPLGRKRMGPDGGRSGAGRPRRRSRRWRPWAASGSSTQRTTSLEQFARRAALEASTRQVPVLEVGADRNRYQGLFAATSYLSVAAPSLSAPDRLPVPSAHFGLVLCADVVDRTPEPEDVLAECNRALNVGGRLFLSTPLVVVPRPSAVIGRPNELGLNYLLQASGFEIEDLQAVRNTANYAVVARKSPPASRAVATRGHFCAGPLH